MSGAEALAAFSLAGTIVQFIDYGGKVLERLDEFRVTAGGMPESWQDIASTLQLLLTALSTTAERARAGNISAQKQAALQPVVYRCRRQIEELDALLQKYLPRNGDSSIKIRIKAWKSVHKDNEVERIKKRIGDFIQALTYHETTNNGPISTSYPSPSASRPMALFMVAFSRDAQFVRRQGILDAIDAKLARHRQVGLYGVGGVGKTQLAVETCYRFRDVYPYGHVFWIHASTYVRLIQAYKLMAEYINLPGWNDPNTDIIQSVNIWLGQEANGPWLAIFDNVDDLNTLASNSPSMNIESSNSNPARLIAFPHSPNGSILITTRDKRISQEMLNTDCSIPIPPMSDAEATILLKQKMNIENLAANELNDLFETLGHMPLALTQAIAFMNANTVSVHEYLKLLHGDESEVTDLLEENRGDARRDRDSDTSIFKTWRISFETISHQNPRAADTLALMAMLDRQSIPKKLLAWEGDRESDTRRALGVLQAFSLIEVGQDPATYSLHRLVQLATQSWLQINEQKDMWQSKALRVISNAFPNHCKQKNDFCEILHPHASAVLNYRPANHPWRENHVELLDRQAFYYYHRGRYLLSAGGFELELDVRKDMANQEEKIVRIMTKLTDAYAYTGQYEQARRVGVHGNQTSEIALGKDHALTVLMKRSLARVCKSMGHCEEAETLLQECIEGCRKLNDTELLNECMRTLGQTYAFQERWEDAMAVELQLLEENKRRFGLLNSKTLLSMHNIALTYLGQGRLVEAESIMSDVVKFQKEILDDSHPDVLQSVKSLTNVLRKRGRYEEAKALLKDMLKKQCNSFGEDSVDVVKTLSLLAGICKDQHRYQEAEAYYKDALERSKRLFGEDNEFTINLTVNLVRMYNRQPAYEAAVALCQRTLELAVQALPKHHAITIDAIWELARAYQGQGQWQEAASLLSRVLEADRRQRGGTHRLTVLCMKRLAELYRKLDRPNEATQLEEELAGMGQSLTRFDSNLSMTDANSIVSGDFSLI